LRSATLVPYTTLFRSVGVARAVDVRVVTILRLVLDVRRVDRDAALLLLGGVVDRLERPDRCRAPNLLGEHLRDGGRQRRLAVVEDRKSTRLNSSHQII